MTTRRKFGLGIAAIIAAQRAPAALVRSLIAARAALTGGKKLPYDAEVAFLGSTGTQRIDTGIIATNGIVLSGKSVKYNNNSVCGWSIYDCLTNHIEFRWRSVSIVVDCPNGTLFTFVWGKQIIFDGVVQGDRSTIDADQNKVMLFCRRSDGNDSLNGRIYWFKIENENGLVRDFIPVRFTNELGMSEGAMYDRANPAVGMNPDGSPRTDGLYRNRGTGAFAIGPVKARGASGQNGGGISG